MKRYLPIEGLAVLVFTLFSFSSFSQAKFVKTSGSATNSGDSWDMPFATISQALAAGASEIFVAEGTYIIKEQMVASAAYALSPQCRLLKGGYPSAANGTDLSKYNPAIYRTFIENGSKATSVFAAAKTNFTLQGVVMPAAVSNLMVDAKRGATYTFKDLIVNNTGTGEAVTNIVNGATFNYTNLVFENIGTTTFNIEEDGIVNMDKCYFINCGSNFNGAVYKYGLGVLNITKSGFCNNYNLEGRGSAIEVGGGLVNVSYSFFNENKTQNIYQTGEAIFAHGTSAINKPVIVLDSVTFFENYTRRGLNTSKGDLANDGFFFSFTMTRCRLQNTFYNDVYYNYGNASNAYNGNVFGNTLKTAECDPLQILPLTGFTLIGQWANGKPQLNWKTISEINLAYFEIEKSIDGEYYTSIGRTNAAGNSTTIRSYAFVDQHLANRVVYFRIKAISQNGTINYSNVIVLKDNASYSGKLNIFPNPVRNLLNIETALAGNYLIELYSLEGKKIVSQKQWTASGLITLSLNRASLAAGTYQLKLINVNNNDLHVGKVVLQ